MILLELKYVTLPEMTKYYITDEYKDMLIDRLMKGYYDNRQFEFNVYCDNDVILFDILRIIISKSEKITLGDQMKCEYELDTKNPTMNIFKFVYDDHTVEAALRFVSIACTDKMQMNFIIV